MKNLAKLLLFLKNTRRQLKKRIILDIEIREVEWILLPERPRSILYPKMIRD
jgi:hypothetical protein